MEIVLVGREPELTAAWERTCGDMVGVTVTTADILAVACDAVVSPANSFGFMGGGIDLAYARGFGAGLERRVRTGIAARWGGELPVGCAEIAATSDVPGHGPIPWLLVAPTMRVPGRIDGTVNAYLAARAALRLVAYGVFPADSEGYGEWARRPVRDAIRRLALPGLGTGTGRMAPEACARQVRAAIEEVRYGAGEPPPDMAAAMARHRNLARG
ncbi:MAG: macro domain-containing protein [Austwickia sp.]|nr:MAG: macro domain-containing protein [Austwickia sp.]